MSSLHPDLDALAARYQDLVAAATQGHITPDDALATLSGLSVVDGSGAVWKVDKEGAYIRSEYAGAPPVPADPTGYIGPETVNSNPQTGQFNIGPQPAAPPTWAAPPTGLPNPPDGVALVPPAATGFGAPATSGGFPAAPAGGFGGAPAAGGFGGAPAGGFGGAQEGGFGAPAQQPGSFMAAADAPTSPFDQAPGAVPFTGPEQHMVPPAALSDPASRQRAPKNREPRGPNRFLEVVKKNKFLVVVALLAVVFVAQRFLFSSDEGTTVPTKPAPTASAPAEHDEAPSLTPDSAAAAPSAPATAKLPIADDINTVVGALTDGDRRAIAEQVATEADPGRAAHAAAFYKGLKGAGLDLNTGKSAPGPQAGTAVQSWTVTDGSTKLLTIDVTWTQQGGKWLLTDVPVPQ